MDDVWSILLVALAVLSLGVGIRIATGNKPWSESHEQPTTSPAGPGAEGMGVAEAGEIVPGEPADPVS